MSAFHGIERTWAQDSCTRNIIASNFPISGSVCTHKLLILDLYASRGHSARAGMTFDRLEEAPLARGFPREAIVVAEFPREKKRERERELAE